MANGVSGWFPLRGHSLTSFSFGWVFGQNYAHFFCRLGVHETVAQLTCAREITNIYLKESFERLKWPSSLFRVLVVLVEMKL